MTAPLPDDVASLLVVCPTWVGDTVMATGVLRALRAARPDASITTLVRPGHDELLAGSPGIDDLLVAQNRGLAGPVALARRLRPRRFEAALVLPNSFRSALTVRLAGITRRVGFARDGRSWLLTHPVPTPDVTPVPTVDYYRRLLEGAIGSPVADATPRLVVTDAQRAAANLLLEDVEAPLAVLNPGAVRASKRWPAERFAILADTLLDRGIAVAVTGAPAERGIVDEVIAEARSGSRLIDLIARRVDLGTLKGVLERAVVLVTNDTGPRHVAAALGTPVVSLFGPTDHRWTTLPGAREQVLLAEPFLPESVVADDVPGFCRMDRISVGDVLAAVERLHAASTG